MMVLLRWALGFGCHLYIIGFIDTWVNAEDLLFVTICSDAQELAALDDQLSTSLVER
jgi:hypothetical protein